MFCIDMHYKILFWCRFKDVFPWKGKQIAWSTFSSFIFWIEFRALEILEYFVGFSYSQHRMKKMTSVSLLQTLNTEQWTYFWQCFKIYLSLSFLTSDGQWVKNLDIYIQHFAIVTFEWEFTKFHKKRQVNILVWSSIFLFH